MFSEDENCYTDELARIKAIDPTQSFLIQAPAGSGKTELLTDRVMALLVQVSQPEEIVAITFTRKAAFEMRSRIIEKLNLASNVSMPIRAREYNNWLLSRRILSIDKQRNWGLLKNPNRLKICTIDSFCVSLYENIDQSERLASNLKIIENAKSSYLTAAYRTLNLADQCQEIKSFLKLMDVNIGNSVELIANMLEKRDQWLIFLQEELDQSKLEEGLKEIVDKDLEELISLMPCNWNNVLPGIAKKAARALQGSLELNKRSKLWPLLDWELPLLKDEASIVKWKALAELLLTDKGRLRSSSGFNKSIGFPKGSPNRAAFLDWFNTLNPNANWIRCLNKTRDIPDLQLNSDQWSILTTQLRTLMIAVQQLQLIFLESGEMDLIKIIQTVSSNLEPKNRSNFLRRKIESISHLLVDEFQDTNQSQQNLIKGIIADWEPTSGKTLFLVGDPMQSIYRFRKAEVGFFIRAAKNGIGRIKPNFLRLTNNFRSKSGLVNWINSVFPNIFPDKNNEILGAIEYSASKPTFHDSLESDNNCVHMHPIITKKDDSNDIANYQSENISIELIKNALQKNKNNKKPIAILVRSRHHLGNLIERLELEKIPYSALDFFPMKKNLVICDLLQLLRAFLNPGDRLAWLSVLRSPLCGITIDTMHAIFGHDHITPIPILLKSLFNRLSVADSLRNQDFIDNAKCLASSELIRIKYFFEVFMDKNNESGLIPIAEWLQFLWNRLGGASLYSQNNAEQDAECLFQIIESMSQYGNFELAELEKKIEDVFLSRTNVSELDTHNVEIMTIHKAKGLQFETVILYGLHRLSNNSKRSVINFEQTQTGNNVVFGPLKSLSSLEKDPISHYLEQREHERNIYEAGRLLYVASTRACKNLHLIGNVVLNPSGSFILPPLGSFLRMIWPFFEPVALEKSRANNTQEIKYSKKSDGLPLCRTIFSDLLSFHKFKKPAYYGKAEGFKSNFLITKLIDNSEKIVNELLNTWIFHFVNEFPYFLNHTKYFMKELPIIKKQLTRLGIPEKQVFQKSQIILETLECLFHSNRKKVRHLLYQLKKSWKWPLIETIDTAYVLRDQDVQINIISFKIDKAENSETLKNFIIRMKEKYSFTLLYYCKQLGSLEKNRKTKASIFFPRNDIWIDLQG